MFGQKVNKIDDKKKIKRLKFVEPLQKHKTDEKTYH